MRVSVLIIFLFSFLAGNGQKLQKLSLTKEDSAKGIRFRYEYSSADSYNIITLLLKSNKTYTYHQASFAINDTSEGKWEMSKKHIILKSKFRKNNIPVQVGYGTDGDFVNN